MLNLLQHHVLLLTGLRQTSQMHPHVLAFLHLSHLSRIQAPLHFEFFIVLIHFFFPLLILRLLIWDSVLVDLVYFILLLGFIHYFLEWLRQRVFLQVILKDSLLPDSSLPYFVQVDLLIVGDQQAVILLKQAVLRRRSFHHLILLVVVASSVIWKLFWLLRLKLMRSILISYALSLSLSRNRGHRLVVAGFCTTVSVTV